MKPETRDAVRKSLADIDDVLGNRVAGAGKLQEGLSDEEFKELVQTLTQDIADEFAEAKKRAFEDGFQAGLKSAAESKPLVVTQQPHFEREIADAERSLSRKIEGLFSEHDKIHEQLGEADASLHSEIRELRDEIEALKKQAKEEEQEETAEEPVGETSREPEEIAGEVPGPEEEESGKPEMPRRAARSARRPKSGRKRRS